MYFYKWKIRKYQFYINLFFCKGTVLYSILHLVIWPIKSQNERTGMKIACHTREMYLPGKYIKHPNNNLAYYNQCSMAVEHLVQYLVHGICINNNNIYCSKECSNDKGKPL